MYGVVKIGKKDVEMVANAATPYRYKQIFREDYLKKISSPESDGLDSVDVFVKMGFVMAKQAEKADMSKLNEESFFAWLEQFDPMDVNLAADKIANIFNGNAEGSAAPKEKAAE